MLIARTPEPEFLSSAFHDDFVQIPNIAGRETEQTRQAKGRTAEGFLYWCDAEGLSAVG